MKRIVLALLTVLMLVIPAYATDRESIPDTPQDEAQFIVSTWEELQVAADNAEDGDTITLADGFIQIPNGVTLGSADKHIVIQLSSQYVDRYEESPLLVFNTGENPALIQNITFNGNNIPANNIVFLCGDATVYGCTFKNCTIPFDTGCIRTAGINANIANCDFSDNYGTSGVAVSIAQNGYVEINNCRFVNNSGLQGGVIHNNGTVKFGVNYIKNNTAEDGGHVIFSYGEVEIDLNMEDYNSLYGYTPKGWYYDSIIKNWFTTTSLDEWEPVELSYIDQFCCLAFDSDNSMPDTLPEQPQEPGDQTEDDDTTEEEQPPQEPVQPLEGEGTDNPDNPDNGDQDNPQEPTQPPQDGNEDDPADTPTQTPEQPVEPPQDDTPDNPADTTPDTPQPPQEPADSDNGNNDNYPPTDYRPSQRPIWPVVTVKPTGDNKPQDQPDNTPAPVKPQLVCNSAVIDTSRTVVLLGYGDGLTHEDDPLTRAQLATIVYRLLDEESIALYGNAQVAFADVAADAWYAPYVSVIQVAGIVNGVGDGKYDPNGTVTWAQIITILTRFVEPQKCTLQHIQYSGWAVQAIQTAVANGWIEDRADFIPDAVIGRGELAQLINSVLALYR